MRKWLSAPIDVSIELTDRCNLSCVHCLQPSHRTGSLLETDEIMALARELSDMNVFSVFLAGGEPLLRPDWYEIAVDLHNMGFAVGLSTNGTLITKDVARKLKDSELHRTLQISLDGSCAGIHDDIRGDGVFQKVMTGLAHLAQVGIHPNIAVTVMKRNIHDVPAIVRLAAQKKLRHVHVIALMPAGRSDPIFHEIDPSLEAWIELEDQLRDLAKEFTGMLTIDWANRRYQPSNPTLSQSDYTETDRTFSGCPGATSRADIDCYGNVYGCDILKNPDYCAGNIRRQSFNEIWHNSEVFRAWRERRADTTGSKCHQCKWFFACAGGCPAFAVFQGLTIQDPDPSCPGPIEADAIR